MKLNNQEGCSNFNIEIDCFLYTDTESDNTKKLEKLLNNGYNSVEIYVPAEFLNKTNIYETYDKLNKEEKITGTVWSDIEIEDIVEHFLDYHTPYIQSNDEFKYLICIPEKYSDQENDLLTDILNGALEGSIDLLSTNIANCENEAPYLLKEEQLYKENGIKMCGTFEDYDKVDAEYLKKEDKIFKQLDMLKIKHDYERKLEESIKNISSSTFDDLLVKFDNRKTVEDYRSGKIKMPF